MDKELLKRYQKNKTELVLLEKALDRLYEQLDRVDVISGKVTKSMDEFPYIEEHVTVQMADPKRADQIKRRIREKEKHREKIVTELLEAENYIDRMPEGIDKQIFDMVYLEGISQKEAGEAIGYTQSMVSKIISSYLKDS